MTWLWRVWFIAAIGLAFAGGLFVAILDWPPAPAARGYLGEMSEAAANWRSLIADQPSYHLEPAVYAGEGVVAAEPTRMQPGVTLLTGLFGNRLTFRLVDAEGKLAHEWPIDFFAIAPERMKHRFHALIHGTVLYPNGDIVANLDGHAMVRIDRCGRIIWRNSYHTHHSIHADDQGGLWAPALPAPVAHPHLSSEPFGMDTLVRIDPATGERAELIPLLAVLDASDRLGLARLSLNLNRRDVIHANDVEPLSAGMAAAFPMFAAGDLLVSSRNLHQLWVVDGASHRLKWLFIGPLQGQHDPDFQPDGTITVFDNLGRSAAAGGPASRILAIDPATQETRTLFRGSPEAPFYTPFRGKHQVLDNGNILITETDRGRAFEVTSGGEVVWSYVNRYDDEQVGWLMQAERYPAAYAPSGSGCG